jgi:hypothetical protein
MTFIPGCERDVFISYAHDNDHDGWVTRFQKSLAAKLTEYLGAREKPSIWFDDRNLRAGDPVSTEIRQILERSAALVSVISPSYLSSRYCIREELEHFLSAPQTAGRVIIQALKVPLRAGQQMPLPGIKFVEFLDRGDNGDIEELDSGDPRFTRVMNKVANQLGTHLEEMRRTRQAVFIAEPADATLLDAAQLLRTELHGHGYRVPDERVASFTSDDLIRGMIESADLSVHFFSGAADPLASRQFEIARTMAKSMVLATLVPLDTAGLPAECGIPVLIAGQGGLTPLSGDWKQRLIDQIRKRLQPAETPDDDQPGAPLHIYVCCSTKGNLGEAADLIDTLRERQCEVLRPDFRILDPSRQQQDHEGKLGRADGVVLFGAEAQAAHAMIDPTRYVVAECPAASPSRAGVHAIGEALAELDGYLEAVATRHRNVPGPRR